MGEMVKTYVMTFIYRKNKISNRLKTQCGEAVHDESENTQQYSIMCHMKMIDV
jgi:hypothetical protein